MTFPRLLCILLLLTQCGQQPVQQQADQRFDRFLCYPRHQSALRCIAPYEEYCNTFGYQQHERNRDWIERIRHHAAERLLALYRDHQMNHPSLKYLFKFRKRKVLRDQGQWEVRFYHKNDSTCVMLKGGRFSAKGYLLPCEPHFSTTAPH